MASYPRRQALFCTLDKTVMPKLRQVLREYVASRTAMEAHMRSGKLQWGRLHEAREAINRCIAEEERMASDYRELCRCRTAALSLGYLIDETMTRLKELLK